MRITLIDDSIPFDGSTPRKRSIGGAEKAFVGLSEAFAAKGYEVTAVNRCESYFELNGNKAPSGYGEKLKTSRAFMGPCGVGLNAYDAKAFILFLFAEVYPLQATGIDYGWLLAGVEVLVFVNMAESYIVKGRVGECAGEEDWILADSSRAFGAGKGSGSGGEMGGKHCWKVWIELA